MCQFCGIETNGCLVIDGRHFDHIFNTAKGVSVPHIGTHRDALHRMMQGDANLASMRRALEDAHRKLYPSAAGPDGSMVAGPMDTGANILVYCKWGKRRMVVVVVVVVVLVLLLVVVVVVVVLWSWWNW